MRKKVISDNYIVSTVFKKKILSCAIKKEYNLSKWWRKRKPFQTKKQKKENRDRNNYSVPME